MSRAGMRPVGAAVAAVAFALFGLLAWAVIAGATEVWDTQINAAMHDNASDALTSLAFALSFLGSAPVWVPITAGTVIAFVWLGRRKAAIDLAIVMAGAVLLENGLKLAFARARPDIHLGVPPATFGFPSGHAIFAACLYGALACLIADRISSRAAGVALWAAAVLIAALIGVSRLYLGMHYASDVGAGYLVAIFWIGAVTALRASDEP